ncbi:MAG: conjugal transfer protein TraF [Gallionella sp.]
MKTQLKITVVAVSLACGSAFAQDSTYDPRSLAMGGTGVTTSDISNAAFHNPAMLASARADDHFTMELPIISLRLLDPNNLQNSASNLSTNASNLTNALNAFQAAPAAATAVGASAALTAFNSSLQAVSQKSLSADALIGVVLAIPSSKYAASLVVDGRVEAAGQFNYAAADNATITTLSTNLNTCEAGGACSTAGLNAGGKVANLTSSLQVRGVIAKDVGIAMAHHFDDFYGLDLGVVPKITQYASYDYTTLAQNNAKVTLNQGQKDFSGFNVDVGASKAFKTDNGNDVKAGLALKNLMPQSYTTVLGNNITVKPQVTAGASYVTKLTTAGVDLDLIHNQAMLTGMVKDSQYLRLGAEFDAWRWAQIRVGYRHDLLGNYPGLPSIGLGLSPFGIHFDFSVAAASRNEMAVSLQSGFRF